MGSRKRPAVGDVFAVPLRGMGYGFGRIIYIEGKWRIAEFFNCFKKNASYSEEIISSGRVMPIYNIVTSVIESGDWPIVFRGGPFEAPGVYDVAFYRGLSGERSFVNLSGGRVDPDSEAARKATSSMPQFSEFISDRLWEALKPDEADSTAPKDCL